MKHCFVWAAALLLALPACKKDDEPLNDDNQNNTPGQTTPEELQTIPDDMEKAFPDPLFRAYVLNNFDTDGDGRISPEEAETVTGIEVSSNYYMSASEKIGSLEGVQYFTRLTDLSCNYNQLTELDLSRNTELTTLYCTDNRLTTLDLSGCAALTSLDCSSNRLTALDVSGCPELTSLYCADNQLTTLNVSHNPALTSLYCPMNPLETLILKTGQSIEYITYDRSKFFIPDETKLEYVD